MFGWLLMMIYDSQFIFWEYPENVLSLNDNGQRLKESINTYFSFVLKRTIRNISSILNIFSNFLFTLDMFVPLYYTHTVERDGIHRFIFTFLSQVKLICYLWVHKGRSKMYLGFEVRKKMLLLHEKFLLHYDRLHQVTRNTNVFVTWLFFVILFPAKITYSYP